MAVIHSIAMINCRNVVCVLVQMQGARKTKSSSSHTRWHIQPLDVDCVPFDWLFFLSVSRCVSMVLWFARAVYNFVYLTLLHTMTNCCFYSLDIFFSLAKFSVWFLFAYLFCFVCMCFCFFFLSSQCFFFSCFSYNRLCGFFYFRVL